MIALNATPGVFRQWDKEARPARHPAGGSGPGVKELSRLNALKILRLGNWHVN